MEYEMDDYIFGVLIRTVPSGWYRQLFWPFPDAGNITSCLLQ